AQRQHDHREADQHVEGLEHSALLSGTSKVEWSRCNIGVPDASIARGKYREPRRRREDGALLMTRTLRLAAFLVIAAATAHARQSGAPRNDLPQPYRTTRDWGHLPPSVGWGARPAPRRRRR